MRDNPPPATPYAGDQAKVESESGITVRRALDKEITRAEERVQALKDVKKRLEDRGVLDCRIQDLRAAMHEIY